MSFVDLGLSEKTLTAVGVAGYLAPTPIQKRAIPVVLHGGDVLGCAQTGTGKTASFVLPMLDLLAQGRARARMPRSLILEPTRELAAQVAENFDLYGKHHRLSKALLIGGVSFDEQRAAIDRGVDVLIATPGRLLDHFSRSGLLLRGIEILVIDEADRMLDMGFIPDVERIVKLTNPKRQTLFFSATMPHEIRKLADTFLTRPNEINVTPPASPAENVDQWLTIVNESEKLAALHSLIRSEAIKNAFVFCNRKRDVNSVEKSLRASGINCAPLHGDMDQANRMRTLEDFKTGDIEFLVCSDVAARGIDVHGMSHVFLFDVPTNKDDYIHRIGRTGRAGMQGKAFTLGSPFDKKLILEIEKHIGKSINHFEIKNIDPPLTVNRRRVLKKQKPRLGSEAPKTQNTLADKPSKKNKPENIDENVLDARTKDNSRGQRTSKVTSRGYKRDIKILVDEDEPVIGMGEHIPAFMLRSTKR